MRMSFLFSLSLPLSYNPKFLGLTYAVNVRVLHVPFDASPSMSRPVKKPESSRAVRAVKDIFMSLTSEKVPVTTPLES